MYDYGREGVCGGRTVGSYRTLIAAAAAFRSATAHRALLALRYEHSERITSPQAAPNKNNQSFDWLFLFGVIRGRVLHLLRSLDVQQEPMVSPHALFPTAGRGR